MQNMIYFVIHCLPDTDWVNFKMFNVNRIHSRISFKQFKTEQPVFKKHLFLYKIFNDD